MLTREKAWDAKGVWCGDGGEPKLFPKLDRTHQCGRREWKHCGRFVCSSCKRCVPWCFGGDGTLCDDCWCEKHPDGIEPMKTSDGTV